LFKSAILAFIFALALFNGRHAFAQANSWVSAKKDVTHAASGAIIPTKLGFLSYSRAQTISNAGSGLNTVGQWQSADQQSSATVAIYKTTLADPAIAAIIGNQGVLNGFGTATHVARDTYVAVGGTKAVARRIDYDGAKIEGNAIWLSRAFLKSGDWLIKVEIGGPQANAAALNASMTALLTKMRFAKGFTPLSFPTTTLVPCRDEDRDDSGAVIKPMLPTAIAAQATVIVGVDFNARSDGGQRVGVRRMPSALCITQIRSTGGLPIVILRPIKGGSTGLLTELGMIAVMGESTTMVEITRVNPNNAEYLMIAHGVGEAALLPVIDRPLSERQVVDLFSNPKTPFASIQARYRINANGDISMNVDALPPQKAQ
jgi:hypothetical protein